MSIIVRYHQLLQEIAVCAKKAQRSPENITLLAVSKKQTIESIECLAAQGQRDFAESYLQEALTKINHLKRFDINWHFIGKIQSNKTQAIATHFSWVHSLDRLNIALRLSQQRPTTLKPLNVCIQVNLQEESQKGGIPISDCEQLAFEIRKLPNINLRGLMALPKKHDPSPLQTFSKLNQHFSSLKKRIPLDTLSMGMSQDFEEAIQAGSHVVRIGEGLFGPRDAGIAT